MTLLITFIIAMVPVLELRGAIPFAAFKGVEVWLAALVAVIGNMIPCPLIILCMNKLLQLFGKTKLIGPILTRFAAKAEEKSKTLGRYEFWGLLIFVGIPLPGTGAWTGSMIASVLKMPKRKALPAIFGGIVMSGTIMCIISYALPELFIKLFG